MTNDAPQLCPKCGSTVSSKDGNRFFYSCGSYRLDNEKVVNESLWRSELCCEIEEHDATKKQLAEAREEGERYRLCTLRQDCENIALKARVERLECALREIESQHLHTEDAMIDLSDLMAMRAQQSLASTEDSK